MELKITAKKETNVLKSKPCPNCSEPNKPESKFCFKCKMVLTFDSYKETLEKQIEKEEQIKSLILRLDQYEEANRDGRIMSKEYKKSMDVQHNRLAKLEERFEELTARIDIERKLEREFELETDSIKKEQKFDKMLSAKLETIRKRSNLEDSF
jgi:2-oxoglutarate dehydrogenase complex dehydrogenase (E1) component-like enzyme